MAMAIENHILGKAPESVVISKGEISKHGVRNTITTSAKKSKPVIANKEIYKQRMEEKKAQAAARRAERAAERARKEAEALAAEAAAKEAAAKAAAKSAAKPATKPATKVAKPAAKPATKVVKPAAKPATKVAKTAAKVVKPAATTAKPCDMFGRDIVSARAVKDSEYYAVLQGLNIAGAADLSFMGVFFLVDEEAEEGGFFVDGDDEA